MKLSPISRLLAAACFVFALSSSEAAAQPDFTPSVSAVATGNTVAITVGHMPAVGGVPAQLLGLLSYELVAYTPGLGTQDNPNIAAVMIPAVAVSSGPLVVQAPPGIYALRVRGAIGPVKGPWSNEAVVSVGLETCSPGFAPAVSVSVDQNTGNVTASWTPVPGTIFYVVQWGQAPGEALVTETVLGTSITRQAPTNGTFYASVVAVTNGCGNPTSTPVGFTVELVRRFLSPGEILSHLAAVRTKYSDAFYQAHRGGPESWDFIILACRRLYQVSGGTVGCNWKRAVVGGRSNLSMDGLTIQKADGRFYFADVIASAGTDGASLYYNELGLLFNQHGQYAPQGFANPLGVPGSYDPLRTHVDYGPDGGW